MDAMRRVAEEALATLTRLRSSMDQNDVAKQITALTPKMGSTGEGWSNARHDAWIATCHLRDALLGIKKDADLHAHWDWAISATKAWLDKS